jgi:predicted metal-dependent hydrolase
MRKQKGRKEYLARREEARTLVHEKLEFFNQHYGFKYNKVFIKNLRSRWGSCSRKGNLNFHYKILDLAPSLQDYLIVHELCHLKEFNHGEHFWALVEEVIPSYHERRRALRKHKM